MNYPAPAFGAPAAANVGAASAGKVAGIIVGAMALAFAIAAAMAIALGVGLGVGLTRGESNSGVRTTQAVATVATTTINPNATNSTTNSTANRTCTCSCSSIAPTAVLTRIINGNIATANSWPWMVLLMNGATPVCGGTLISYRHVLTSATCAVQVTSGVTSVYAGIQDKTNTTGGDARIVVLKTSHPNYDPAAFTNDIAVLNLVSNFTPSAKIGISCLPSGLTQLPAVAEKGLIMGWGLIAVPGAPNGNTKELRQGVVDILSVPGQCVDEPNRFCAGRGATTTCTGDEGGPLMTSVNNTWTCTGIAVQSGACTGVNRYTRVSAYRAFIDQALAT